MASQVLLGKDANGATTYELPVGQNIRNTTLSANIAQSVTVPVGCNRAFFSYSNGVDVYVEFKTGISATLPTGAFQVSTSELNPVGRYGIVAGSTLSFISPTTAYVSIYFSA